MSVVHVHVMSCVNHVTINETIECIVTTRYSNECGTCMSCVNHVTANETIECIVTTRSVVHVCHVLIM